VRTLPELRARIDELDVQLIAVLAERMAICREVAEAKEAAGITVIQPERVRDVLASRMNWADAAGIEPEFAEQVFRVVLAETHRIEMHLDPPSADAISRRPPPESALDLAACRIDHVSVVVGDLDAAVGFFVDQMGFRLTERSGDSASAVVEAGGVTVVLTQPLQPDSVAAGWLREHGPGVQHLAIEVLNASFVREALVDAGVPLLGDVAVGANGLEHFFTLRDPSSGIHLGFVSRTGERSRFDGDNVRTLSAAMDAAAPS
jgi:chorismate mutase/catechol 2,3-dioxygenase-like lactoylglutathione lyase family enzyme